MAGILTDRFGRPLDGATQGPAIQTPNTQQVDLAIGIHDQHVVVLLLVGGKVVAGVPLSEDQATHHIAGMQQATDQLRANRCPPECPPTAHQAHHDIVTTINTSEIEGQSHSTTAVHGSNYVHSSYCTHHTVNDA